MYNHIYVANYRNIEFIVSPIHCSVVPLHFTPQLPSNRIYNNITISERMFLHFVSFIFCDYIAYGPTHTYTYKDNTFVCKIQSLYVKERERGGQEKVLSPQEVQENNPIQ